ncbi:MULTISPECIES: hypothetical protein [Brenneria]|uniref:hypothetical protein n=1 Tax=Brenneria TaxID=71655 RepID=UPI00109DEEC8|nr:hypothetical protein [Brenneria roseae]
MTLLTIPALPVIQNTIKSMSPQITESFDLSMIQRICLLARGEATKEQVRISLEKDGINPATIPVRGHALSPLVNDDQYSRQLLCATYIASSILMPLDSEEITVKTPREIKEKKDKKTVYDNVINNDKLMSVLAVKTSIARTNAEYFALIAVTLEKQPGLSLEAYTIEVKKKFSALASHYLKRVQSLYSPSAKGYKLISLNEGDYTFNTDGGYTFSRDHSGALLTYDGINWLGKGEIMGEKYALQVSFFSPEVMSALNTDKNE